MKLNHNNPIIDAIDTMTTCIEMSVIELQLKYHQWRLARASAKLAKIKQQLAIDGELARGGVRDSFLGH